MAKITFMVPYPEICDEIQQVFEEQNDGNWTIELIVVDGVPRQIDYKKIKADVVVARGISASVAQTFLNDVPIIRSAGQWLRCDACCAGMQETL
ncbi:MAG: hypothetical protein AB9917_02290 [Negativicutes bacterium]